MRNLNRIVIIGAGAAGLTTAETLRRLGFQGTIMMVHAEHTLPYDRPPLSKQVLAGTWAPEKVHLRSPVALEKLALDWFHGVEATHLDVAGHCVALSDGQRLEFDAAVIATGLTPRFLSSGHDLQGVFVLRTLEQTLALRQALAAGTRLVVVGGGFLGLEAAATAHQLGLVVDVVEPLPVCLEGPLGRAIGERVMHLQTAHGVRLHNGIGVRRLIGDQVQGHGGAVREVVLEDGSTLPADVVLVAVGAQPNVSWLEGSGLTLQNGIVCDAFCQAAPDIYAAGDVANWYHPHVKRQVRLEHRMNATEQGQAVARNILGERQPFAPVPFFWSDQFDVKIQMYGIASRGAELRIVEEALHEDRFVAAYYEEGERLVAVLGWNSPKQLLSYRQRLLAAYTPSQETKASGVL
ncbi:pyridine nucleotide-disulfide oxidoreductase [Ktedonobacter sp. SOSP1-52]|uniref:NAD(P)/FAD-dependent oxidoreductase n=1 Tax=Ktedonobacter sp. SOSP1-52 TaxID=2778366 RepID=UPI001914DD30|nr:FAD-dependent oxidoreductase [Ktedonobacter sp. SOSP1-52]GHO62191.1 pyridine nucleotide-disulfide oxidoreductase [Ktedonobacter sp. SOSP1-52]